jgi:hypothetical protein
MEDAMATSSITKSFTIKSEEALKRFQTEMKKTPSSALPKTNKLEEGKALLKRYFSH